MSYLKRIYEEIPTCSIATVNEDGNPISVVIDIMLYDEDSLYFLVSKGMDLYNRIIENSNIALSGATFENGIVNKKIFSLSGEVVNIGEDKLEEILEKNSYVREIYATKGSQNTLRVFRIFNIVGEFSDKSKNPPLRESFSTSNREINTWGFVITKSCIKCGSCIDVCPVGCISMAKDYNVINQEVCLRCGACYDICPFDAIKKNK